MLGDNRRMRVVQAELLRWNIADDLDVDCVRFNLGRADLNPFSLRSPEDGLCKIVIGSAKLRKYVGVFVGVNSSISSLLPLTWWERDEIEGSQHGR